MQQSMMGQASWNLHIKWLRCVITNVVAIMLMPIIYNIIIHPQIKSSHEGRNSLAKMALAMDLTTKVKFILL